MTSYDWTIDVGERQYQVHCEDPNFGKLKLWINNRLIHDAFHDAFNQVIVVEIDGHEVLLVYVRNGILSGYYDIAIKSTSLTNSREIPVLVSGKMKSIPASIIPKFSSASPSSSPSNPTSDLMSELERIANLLKQGLIDEDEFKALKKKLIEKS
jgi:hypothetical protein